MLEGTHGTAPQGATLGTRIDRDISLFMPLRFVRQLRNNMAQSLVLIVKLGTQRLAALQLEAPNKYIPLLSTVYIRVWAKPTLNY